MDNMNNSNNINTSPVPHSPKPSKFIEVLIQLAKCVGFLLVYLGVQFIAMVVAEVVIMLQAPNLTNEILMDKLNGISIELTVICNLITLGIFFLAYYLSQRSLLKKINISLPDKNAYAPTAVIGVTGQFVTLVVLSFLMLFFPQDWIDMLNQTDEIITNANPILSFFAVVILAPVFEEILCRGLILNTLKHAMPKWYAIVASSAIFGLIHGNPIQFIYATALGILLGWLYTKFDSIWIPILCHLTFNLASQLMSYLDTENMVVSALIGLFAYACVPIFVLAIIYVNLKKFNKKEDNVSVNTEFTPAFPINNAPEYHKNALAELEAQIECKKTNKEE